MDSPVQSARTVGLELPVRMSDCTGLRPSWWPFVVNTCDQDTPDPEPLTARMLEVER